MSQAYREITVWECNSQEINHTYLIEGNNMLAYIRYGTSTPQYFSAPMRIDKRGRKFEEVTPNPFDNSLGILKSNIKEIQGSKGQKYIVDLDEKTCTCSGFTFRGTCKHIKELETV